MATTATAAPGLTGVPTARLPAYAGASIQPFSGVTITDGAPDAVETVKLTFAAGVGAFADGPGFDGLTVQSSDATYIVYSLSGTAAQVTAETDALTYTPVQLDRFDLGLFAVTSGATGRSVSQSVTIQNVGSLGVVTVQPTVSMQTPGQFWLGVSVSNPSQLAGIEFFADVDGVRTDLGAAEANAPLTTGVHLFEDPVLSGVQTNIEAVETDVYGNETSATANFTLQNGIVGEPYTALQDVADPATGAITSQSFFGADGSLYTRDVVTTNPDSTTTVASLGGSYFGGKPFSSLSETFGTDGTLLAQDRGHDDGSHAVIVDAGGQTLTSQSFDTFLNRGEPSDTFAFDPGYGLDVVRGFKLAGDDHDTLSLPSADFAGFADVLANTRASAAGAVILDPVSGDAIRLVGVTVAQVAHHAADFSFGP